MVTPVMWLVIILFFCVAVIAPAFSWICLVVLALLWWRESSSAPPPESFFSPWTETDSPRDPSMATIRTRTCDDNCVPYGQPDPGPGCDLPQIVCDAPKSVSDVRNNFMYPDTLQYMMTNGIPMEKTHGCRMQMIGAAVDGTRMASRPFTTFMGAPPIAMKEDDVVPDMQPNCVRREGFRGLTMNPNDDFTVEPYVRGRDRGIACCESESKIIADYPGLNLPTAESGRPWPQPAPQGCQPWAPGIGDAYRIPGCTRTDGPSVGYTYPDSRPPPGGTGNWGQAERPEFPMPGPPTPRDRSEGFCGYETRDPSGEQAWPPGYYSGCPENKDDPFYKLDQPYKEFERNTDYGTCYAPVSGDYSCEAQRYLDIDAKNAQLTKLRGGQRSRKCSDGWASKNANFYRKNYARELEDYEAKPWWGRQEV